LRSSKQFGPVSRLMTRDIYALLNSHQYWCQLFPLMPEAKQELCFWRDQVSEINGKEVWHSPSAVRVMYSDASDMGYGGFTVKHGYYVVQDAWCTEERTKSSAESHAYSMILESFLPKVRNERIHWLSDNQNVVRILEVGSKNPSLCCNIFYGSLQYCSH